MMNLWRPEDTTEGWNWAGEVDDSVLPLTSEYDYVRFFPLEN
jgi:hypothetical protein